MTGNKKSAFDVATTESGEGKMLTIDNYDFTRNQAKNQGIVGKHLKKGAENAIQGKELAQLIGCRSTRRLQSLVSKERQDGFLILSSENGYFLPSDGVKGREEISRFIATYRSMALNTLKVLKTAKRALTVSYGQMDIKTWQADQV